MIVIEDVAHAVPLVKALVAGGVRVLKVTLRVDAGLELIGHMIAEVLDTIVGTGTVLTPAQLGVAKWPIGGRVDGEPGRHGLATRCARRSACRSC